MWIKLLLASLFPALYHAVWKTYSCRGQASWPITSNDNVEATNNFQNWVKMRMNDFENCRKNRVIRQADRGSGIGSSISQSLHLLIYALESDQIYRPETAWLWADRPELCTLSINSYDCFSQPLSFCQKFNITFNETTPTTLGFNMSKGMIFSSSPLDVCDMGRRSKKPLIWVMGQLILYHMRPRMDIAEDMKKRINYVFDTSNPPQTRVSETFEPSKDYFGVTIGVHIRSGNPDGGRRPSNISDAFNYITGIILKDMDSSGRYIQMIYICSDDLEGAGIISEEHMIATYSYKELNQNYTIKILNHTQFNEKGEVETNLHKAIAYNLTRPSPRLVYLEFLTDIEILVSCDIFIGAHSNVYTLVASLRMARYPTRPLNWTSYIDTHRNPAIIYNEQLNHHFWHQSYGGFDGGASFWN